MEEKNDQARQFSHHDIDFREIRKSFLLSQVKNGTILKASQMEMGKLLKTSRGTIQKWELGKRRPTATARALYRIFRWAIETGQVEEIFQVLKK